MKKVISLILILALCIPLAACGQSPEAKNVQSMIAALEGAAGVDRIEDLKAAQKAYSDLSADDKKTVKNYDVLEKAYVSCWEPLAVGEWCDGSIMLSRVLYDSEEFFNPEALKVNEDHTYSWNYYGDAKSGEWHIENGMLVLGDDFYMEVVNNNGTPALCFLGSSDRPYISKEAYQQTIEDMILKVDLSEKDPSECFGFTTGEEKEFDEFGEPTGTVRSGFVLSNKLYDQGWRYLGTDMDFALEIHYPAHKQVMYRNKEAKAVNWRFNEDAGDITITYNPFSYLNYALITSCRSEDEWNNYDRMLEMEDLSFGRAKGCLYFINSKYVAEETVEQRGSYRYQSLVPTFDPANPFETGFTLEGLKY